MKASAKEVGSVAVDHATARHSGWRRYCQITHLKQQRYLSNNTSNAIQTKNRFSIDKD